MEKRKRLVSGVCATCGAGLGLVSCAAMILATVGAFGLSIGAGLAQVNVPLSRPLLVLSLLLMLLGLTNRGLVSGVLTVVGGILVYLGMFELPPQSSAMAAMESNAGGGFAVAIFWLGLMVIVAAYVVAYWPKGVRHR